MTPIDSFSVYVKSEDEYMYEKGKYQILSEEHDVSKQFDTKGELIAFIVDNLI